MGYLNAIHCAHRVYDKLEALTAFITAFLVGINVDWTDKLLNASWSISIALVSALLVQVMKLLKIPEKLVEKIEKRKKKK